VAAQSEVERDFAQDIIEVAGEKVRYLRAAPHVGVGRDKRSIITIVQIQGCDGAGAAHVDEVIPGAELDVQFLDVDIIQAIRSEAETIDAILGDDGKTVVGGSAVVDIQRIEIGTSIHQQGAGNGVQQAAAVAHMDHVVPRAGIDFHRSAHPDKMDRIGFAAGLQSGRADMRAFDGKRVRSGAEHDVQGLEVEVSDSLRHLQSRQLSAGQTAGLDRGKHAREVQFVPVADSPAAVDGQQGVDRRTVDGGCNPAVHRTVRGRGHVDGVGSVARVDDGGPVDRSHLDQVGAAAGIQRHGNSVLRAVDRKPVPEATERDIQILDGLIRNPQCHSQPGQTRAVQGAFVCFRIARRVHIQRVAAAIAVDRQQRKDAGQHAMDARSVAADIHRVVVSAAINRGGRADGLDVDGVLAPPPC